MPKIKSTFTVPGMSCGHCEKAVKNALTALPGIESIRVDLATKTAVVEYNPSVCDVDMIKSAIEEAGYDAETA